MPPAGRPARLARSHTGPEIDLRARLRPAEFLHGQTGVPDFGHVADLVAVEVHHIDIVGLGALARRRARTALAAMRRMEDTIGGDVFSLLVGGERFDL